MSLLRTAFPRLYPAVRASYKLAAPRLARVSLGGSLGMAAGSPFWTAAPRQADASASSTVWREASPAALRKQPVELVFLSVEGKGRDDWKSFIGYFRNEGYDCIDLNVAVEGAGEGASTTAERLAEELTTQLRQASTQRQPVLLVRGSQGIEVALAQVTSKDPRISGLVILGAADAKTTERAPKKLRIVVLPDNDEALKAAEKWMRSQGFS